MVKKIGDIDVEMSSHTTLNATKRVRVWGDLLNCAEEEIAAKLGTPLGVISCR